VPQAGRRERGSRYRVLRTYRLSWLRHDLPAGLWHGDVDIVVPLHHALHMAAVPQGRRSASAPARATW